MKYGTHLLFAVAILLAAGPAGEASTPWGLLARKVIGRVEQMSQVPKDGQPGFDVATVILNADAAKVYATAASMLHRNPSLHVTADDTVHRMINFNNGTRSAGITVNDLGTRMSQIVVASATMPGQDSATMQIVDGILHVCQEMKVSCTAR